MFQVWSEKMSAKFPRKLIASIQTRQSDFIKFQWQFAQEKLGWHSHGNMGLMTKNYIFALVGFRLNRHLADRSSVAPTPSASILILLSVQLIVGLDQKYNRLIVHLFGLEFLISSCGLDRLISGTLFHVLSLMYRNTTRP